MSPPQILSSQIYSYKSLRMMRGNDEMARCKDSFRLSFQHIYTPICSFAVSLRRYPTVITAWLYYIPTVILGHISGYKTFNTKPTHISAWCSGCRYWLRSPLRSLTNSCSFSSRSRNTCERNSLYWALSTIISPAVCNQCSWQWHPQEQGLGRPLHYFPPY